MKTRLRLFDKSSSAYNILNNTLLHTIREFNLKVFYSYEAKRNEQYHLEQPEIYLTSYIKKSSTEIENLFKKIWDLLHKKADPGSWQFLHEAIFLYFIYRDLELSPLHPDHDASQADNQRKLINLLLQHGAALTPYKHPAEISESELISLSCFNNLWRQLGWGKELYPREMNGLSPLDYAEKFQNRYPEMHSLLNYYHERRTSARLVAEDSSQSVSVDEMIESSFGQGSNYAKKNNGWCR